MASTMPRCSRICRPRRAEGALERGGHCHEESQQEKRVATSLPQPVIDVDGGRSHLRTCLCIRREFPETGKRTAKFRAHFRPTQGAAGQTPLEASPSWANRWSPRASGNRERCARYQGSLRRLSWLFGNCLVSRTEYRPAACSEAFPCGTAHAPLGPASHDSEETCRGSTQPLLSRPHTLLGGFNVCYLRTPIRSRGCDASGPLHRASVLTPTLRRTRKCPRVSCDCALGPTGVGQVDLLPSRSEARRVLVAGS